jgi:hypothetical protein
MPQRPSIDDVLEFFNRNHCSPEVNEIRSKWLRGLPWDSRAVHSLSGGTSTVRGTVS